MGVVEFRLLGPVELWAHGAAIPLPALKMKQLYAVLLWEAGRPVSSSVLIDRIWGDFPPAKEAASLQSNVSKLRTCLKLCGDPSISLDQISMGYRLHVPIDCIDKIQFERTVSLALGTAKRGENSEAIRLLRSAEALVRGEEPLAGLPGAWAAEKRAELGEQIREATVQRIILQVKEGDTHAALPELRQLATKHEFDESILELLMRALRAAGRTTDALDAYALFQARLSDQKGLDPRAPLKRLQEELLRDGGAPAAVSRPPTTLGSTRTVVPSTLDRDPLNFVGRRKDVEAITAEIDSQLAAGLSVVFAIDGLPGIGKTTLALHLAHRLRGRCPDGALQLHMRGHDEHLSPTDPETALGLLLAMLGAEPRQIQYAGSLDLAITLWRRHTAGKRLLLFLDDAADAEQITPLIPPGTGNVVLVTARNRLTGLSEATRHPLEAMRDEEGARLFLDAARMGPTTDPALRDVVAACAGIPLALSVAGNTLRTRPAWSIGDLREHFASIRTAQMRKPDAITAPLFRVISTSYRDLPEFERVLLRRLSLNPGPRIPLRAAAVLADAEPSETEAALFNLVEQNLVMEPEHRHYQLHDMMRTFAAHARETEESPEESEAAANRLMYYTIGAVDSATKLVYPYRHATFSSQASDRDFPDGFGFSDHQQAARWLESENGWLRIAVEYWFANGHPREAATLVNLLSRFLDRKNLWKEAVALHESSLAVWRDCESTLGQAQTLNDLAAAHWRLGAIDAALGCAEQALSLWGALEDANGRAEALLQLGRVRHAQHRNDAAIDCFIRCARHWRSVDEKLNAASALQHLSAARFEAGQHKEAIATIEEALELAQTGEDPAIRCNCLNSLGVFLIHLGDHARAEPYYQEALRLADQIGDGNRAAAFAMNLAECLVRLERPENALPLLERAYEAFTKVGDQYRLTSTLIAQAEAHLCLRRTRSAQALIDTAAVLAEQFGDPMQLARVHVAYGRIFAAGGKDPAALHAFRLALGFADEAHIPYLQGIAHRGIGDIHELMGRADAARQSWHRALAAYGDVPQSPEVEVLRQKLGTGEAGAAA
jgi:DNA-binding SARP family transcriptional activator/tetratricopeptide (TPR) repeat protein